MTPIYYNSAYPGSMFDKPHGRYLDKDDIPSSLAHLANHMRDLQLAVDDVNAEAQQQKREKLDLEQELHRAYGETAMLNQIKDV